MKIERIERPLYTYELTEEEVKNIQETIKIVRGLLETQPMKEDEWMVFERLEDMQIAHLECCRTIDLLQIILDGNEEEFY